jgi:CDP-diacylglycerol--serine O-phosphatidyltransferase
MSLPPSRPGIPLRAVIPNAVTALALCSGLSGIRFAITAEWDNAIMFVAIAAVLDGLDGRIARMLRGQSKFGAELDSLSDVVAFGVAPALIIYLWVLQVEPSASWRTYGWVFALAYAVCMALRLARFNARIDAEDQPHKSAGFLTGVPAPAGAGIMLLPIIFWLASDRQWTFLEQPELLMLWSAFSAFLIISSIATWSLGAVRLKRRVRFEAVLLIVLVGVALFAVPWPTMAVIAILYLLSIPFSIMRYAAVKRRRAQAAGEPTLPLSPPLEPVPPQAPSRQRRQPPSAP